MDGNDFMVLAVTLAAHRGEAQLRSAVSRAYYGAFHVARHFINNDCAIAVPASPAAHGAIVSLLNHLGTKDGSVASGKFGSLKGLRNKADYDLHSPVSVNWVRMQVREATEIVRLIELHRGDETAIQSAREYASRISTFIVRERDSDV